MSNPAIYNQNGQIVTNQTFTTGESNNKVASTKFVVDTANLIVNNFKTITDNSFSQVVTPINTLVGGLKDATDASFTKLSNGTLPVGKAKNLKFDADNDLVSGTVFHEHSGLESFNSSYKYMVFQSGSTTNYLRVGDAPRILQGQGNSGVPKWIHPSELTVGNATNATNADTANVATNLNKTSGIVYQSANSQTAVLDYNGAGKLLVSNSAGTEYTRIPPSWVSPSELSVASAEKATSIFGGAPGVIPYQDASGSTKFTAVGTSGYLLKSNGNVAPSWVRIGDLVDNSFGLVNSSISSVQSSLASKADKGLVDGSFSAVNQRINEVIGLGATTLDTTLDDIKEIVRYITDTSTNIVQNMITIDSSLASKANKGLVDASFGLVNDSLALKADKGLVDISLNLKADKTAVAVSLLSFPSKNAVDISLNLKADLLYVDASFNVTSGSIIFPSASQGYATWDLSNTNTLVFSGGVQGGIYNILVTAGVNPSIIRNGIKFSTNSVTSLLSGTTYLLTVTKISSTYCCNLVEYN
jgi:hypothetical protein